MRPLIVLSLYIVLVAVLGALGAPVLWHVVQGFRDVPWMPEAVTGAGFQRVANRAFMLVALVLLPFMLAAMKLEGRRNWGLAVSRGAGLKALALGLIFGASTMAVLVGMQWAIGMRSVDPEVTAGALLAAAVSGLIGGLVISVIEECFFRGGIYAACERDFGFTVAVTVSALVYAAVHFVRAEGDIGPIDGWAGFRMLGLAWEGATHMPKLGPFLALIGVGVFLGVLRRHLGHAVAGMGVHAGWVMMIRLGRSGLDLDQESPLAFLAPDAKAGGYDGVTGYLAAVYMLLLIIALAMWIRTRRRSQPLADPWNNAR